MLAILKREIRSFFNATIGYMAIGFFLVLNGLFLFVFKGEFNIFDYGFADLSKFFLLAPWVFLFLIPAITMKSFSEEKKLGTLELLYIKPISLHQLVLGKFSGTLFLALIALLPTLIYVVCISQLGTTVGNLDMGLVLGSYIGIIFLVATYIAIGLFASTLSENQIVVFITAVVLSFVFYYGFEGVSQLISTGVLSLFIESFGMRFHYENIALGVLDTRDMVYFLSLSCFFLFLTVLLLKYRTRK